MRLRIAPRPIVYGLASLLAGGALSVAGAAIIFNGPLGGTAANAASPAIFYTNTGGAAVPDSSGVSCGLSLTNLSGSPPPPTGFDNELLLTMNNAFPGSGGTFTANVIASGGGAVVQDISLNVSPGGGGTPIPYTAALGSSCGTALSNSTSSPTAVTFTVTAPPASSWTAGATGTISGNLQAVPSGQYSSTACT